MRSKNVSNIIIIWSRSHRSVPKSHFRLLKLRFLRTGDYLSPEAGKGEGGGEGGRIFG